jgi:hypothetical protein
MTNLVKIVGVSAYDRAYWDDGDSGRLSWIIDMDKIRYVETEFNYDVGYIGSGEDFEVANPENYIKTKIVMFDGQRLDFCINTTLGGVGNEIEKAIEDLFKSKPYTDSYNKMKVLDLDKIVNFEFIEDDADWNRLYDF